MKQKNRTLKTAKKKNPGKERRKQEKELRDALRGERVPGTRVVKDRRRDDRKKRMEKEIRES